MDTKYPDVRVKLTGKDGNAFNLMALVCRGLAKAGVPREEQDLFRKEAMSGDYDNLLSTCMKWVDVR